MRLFNLVAILSLLAFTTLSAQDVGFTNGWLELDAQGREQVMRYAEDFKVFLGRAKSEMQFVREAGRQQAERQQAPDNRRRTTNEAGTK